MKSFLKKIITDEARGPFVALLKGVLFALSMLFRLLVALRNRLLACKVLSQKKCGVPVISVGNVTLGGVGKTPLVSFIAKKILAQGKKPVVLMRGYMDQTSKRCAENVASDEALMLKEQSGVDVVVGADRVAQANAYLSAQSCDVFLLDDGFQHRQCARDLDIVVIDASNPWGNGHLLPRGILREPPSALKRADVIVLSKTEGVRALDELKAQIKKLNPASLMAEMTHRFKSLVNLREGASVDPKQLEGKILCSFCSIAHPASFVRTLSDIKLKPVKNFAFMDHYVYVGRDIEALNQFCCENNVDVLMTTQKDAVKLGEFLNDFSDTLLVCVLNIELQFLSGEDLFLERINSVL
ncbi:tetraacyldisaccharide 4'-kinase [Candidatus Omnitrophota bacterium]